MTAPTPPILALNDIRFLWPGGGFQLRVNQFELAAGESLFLYGPSGTGKSTLLSLICGIVTPEAGSIRFDGTDMTAITQTARDKIRADLIGVIFQQFNLVPYLSGRDNILLPLRFAPARRAAVGDAIAETDRLASELDLPAGLLDAPAATLSVGQQQRIAVARAMIGKPKLIIADEPTSSLDASAQARFTDLLFDQVAEAGATLLMVSHDDRLAGRFDRQVALAEIAQTERGVVA